MYIDPNTGGILFQALTGGSDRGFGCTVYILAQDQGRHRAFTSPRSQR